MKKTVYVIPTVTNNNNKQTNNFLIYPTEKKMFVYLNKLNSIIPVHLRQLVTMPSISSSLRNEKIASKFFHHAPIYVKIEKLVEDRSIINPF